MLRVCFNCYGNYTTDSVYQWDLNHTLQITGLTTEQPPTVHFCNKKSDTAIVVQSEMSDGVITVPIPNQFLEEPYNIIAYVHVYDDNNAKTIEVVNIPLTKRPKPDDYQFTENIDIMNFERLEKDFADFTDLIEGEFEQLENNMSDYKSDIDALIDEMERDLSTVDGKKANNAGVGYTYIRPRRDTASAWTTANPVLAEGEIGIEVPDTGVGSGIVKIKFGDGVTAWKDLPYGLELDTLKSDFNNILLSAGINSHLIGDNVIPTKLTFADLIAKTKVTFFNNTTDSTNFPATYGNGVMIPHADSRYREILYFTQNHIFKGYVTVSTGTVTWHRSANASELSNYLPLAGGTMSKDAVIEIPHTTDDRKTRYGASINHFAPTSGGDAFGFNYKDQNENTIGAIGAMFDSGVLKYYYFGGIGASAKPAIYPDGGIEKGYFKRTELSSLNIDELLTPGYYAKANTNNVTGTLPNGWSTDAFSLDVEPIYSSRIRQTIKGVFIGKIATRIYTGTWGPWKYIPYDLSTILWQNASVAGLSEQTIAVDLTNITAIEVQYIEVYYPDPGTYGLRKTTTGRIELDTTKNEIIQLSRFYPRSGYLGGLRDIRLIRTSNQITICGGMAYNESFVESTDNTQCVPTKIIGYTG